ncbi:hypothetical protein [Streptomyces sp. NBC_00356]|uniref:hypothetical protein n=1 Tax=Streptomyces sp. NBC_00356 TaxID=2975724 RepID=UPI002E26ED9E
MDVKSTAPTPPVGLRETKKQETRQLMKTVTNYFQRIQDLTLAGRPDDEIAATVIEEADKAFGLLEPALGDYAVA